MERGQSNERLRHVTVLEEAHHLLRRTSSEQSGERANLLGKSVEMLANSIAEMRTYGEGFIIADQSPGLLDMSVIRNTNTKIVLRLPDQSDRELVGRAAGLNEEQIEELAKLDKGVAAVYQGEWLEPVLCKVEKHTATNTGASHPYRVADAVDTKKVSRSLLDCIIEKINRKLRRQKEVSRSLLDCIKSRELYRKGDRVDICGLRDQIIASDLAAVVKREYLDYISAEEGEKAMDFLQKLAYDFLQADEAIRMAENVSGIAEWTEAVWKGLNPSVKDYDGGTLGILMELIVSEKAERNIEYSKILDSYHELYAERGGVL